MLLKLKAILLFYRTFHLFSNFVTMGLILVSIVRITNYFPLFLTYFLWFKLLTNVGIGYLVQQKYRDQFWFYHNLGLSKTILLGGAFVVDLLVSLLLIGLVYQILLLV